MQDAQRQSPYQLISDSKVKINPKHWMPFGTLVYVLDTAPRDGKPHHKWKDKAKVGVYLGKSPVHSREVALVLDRHTGYVSPQFHIKVDKGFYTLQQERLKSTWQIATGFEEGPQLGIAIKQNKRKYLVARGNTNSEGDAAPISQPGPEIEHLRDQND